MMKYITVFVISLLMGCRLLAQDSSAIKLNQGLKDLNNKMDEIQKHYYEREMIEIKDSYSVGLNNMNYYITIVLGAVTILGVLIGIIGFKSINEAIETMQQIINKGNTQEKNLILWVNLAEICLLSKDVKNFRKFEQIIKNHEDEFQENRPSTTAYLKTYHHFLKGEMVGFKREINSFISNASICLAIERLGGSQMDEFYAELLNDSSPNKNIMLAFVDYLRGAKREEDLVALLHQI